jgi:branched-chain amino acid transport system substrate-binding protein
VKINRLGRWLNMGIVLLALSALGGCEGTTSLMEKFKKPHVPESKGSDVAVRQPTTEPVKIALLVPLSGQYQDIGKQLLDAAQLALFHFNNPNIELLPIDTKDSAATAAEAAQKAVSEHVALILGPLFSDATRAVVPIAQREGINVISFSNDKSLAGTGAFVMGLRPEQPASRTLRYVSHHFGIDRVALLLPEGKNGSATETEIASVIAGYNGQLALVKTQWYPTKITDPATLGPLLRTTYSALRTGTFLGVPNKKPGLFIGDSGDNVQKIASVLATEGIAPGEAQLIGIASWYDPALLAMPSLEGAVFASLPKVKQDYFEQTLFMGTYHYKPRNLASFAYDGVALAATLRQPKGKGVITREMLTNPRGFVGVNGIFRLNNDGLAERGLEVVQIHRGAFRVIDPAPTGFSR